jgi:hypothetical protein
MKIESSFMLKRQCKGDKYAAYLFPDIWSTSMTHKNSIHFLFDSCHVSYKHPHA